MRNMGPVQRIVVIHEVVIWTGVAASPHILA